MPSPEIADGVIPRHRFMSAYEQKIEPPDRKWQYLLFAAEPYETIAFKVRRLNCGSLLTPGGMSGIELMDSFAFYFLIIFSFYYALGCITRNIFQQCLVFI